jgi:hypothetical protein
MTHFDVLNFDAANYHSASVMPVFLPITTELVADGDGWKLLNEEAARIVAEWAKGILDKADTDDAS